MKKRSVVVYREMTRLEHEGNIVKINADFPEIVVVEVEKKEYVGRLVNGNVEL